MDYDLAKIHFTQRREESRKEQRQTGQATITRVISPAIFTFILFLLTFALMPIRQWKLARRSLPYGGRTLVMGVLNVTPDSFSDGGEFFSLDRAVAHAEQMIAEGADIIDIGGESTRPGSEFVSEAEELRRVIPVIERLTARASVPISIDTTKSSVARAALAAGAEIVNDISGLRFDPLIADEAAKARAGRNRC